MSKKLHGKAEKLLDAHVAFIVHTLTTEGFAELAATELDHALKNASKLTLNEVVTRDMIKATVRVYAVDTEFHDGLPELISAIARNVYAHEIHDSVPVNDLLHDHRFHKILDKVLEMKDARHLLVHEVISNPLYSALVSDILYQGIKGYLTQNVMNKNIPGMASMMKLGKSMMSMAVPGLDSSIEEGLKKYIHKNIKSTLDESERFLLKTLNDDKLREMSLDIWHDVKKLPLCRFREYVSGGDVDDFALIGYEFWKELRTSEWYLAMINSGIDSFFDKFGASTLSDLLKEIGIDRDMVLHDIMRFGPHVLQVLKKKKVLEPLIRRNLERFYASTAAAEILAE